MTLFDFAAAILFGLIVGVVGLVVRTWIRRRS